MRYLGLLAAIVVIACVFAYVTRTPTSSPGAANANTYGATINAVRNTVHTAAGAEQRRKWAIAQQMKTYDAGASVTYSTAGDDAETLVAVSESMNSFLCSKIADGQTGTGAAAAGFRSISCRTASGSIIVERELP